MSSHLSVLWIHTTSLKKIWFGMVASLDGQPVKPEISGKPRFRRSNVFGSCLQNFRSFIGIIAKKFKILIWNNYYVSWQCTARCCTGTADLTADIILLKEPGVPTPNIKNKLLIIEFNIYYVSSH